MGIIEEIQAEVARRLQCMIVKEIEVTMNEPTLEELQEYIDKDGCFATDGCWVEPDGYCPHGNPSWLRHLGFID